MELRFFVSVHLLSKQPRGRCPLKKTYNKSQSRRNRTTQFNPDYWEIAVEYDVLSQFSTEQNLHYEAAEEVSIQGRRNAWLERLVPLVNELIATNLTPRQREIVYLYFDRGMTVYEIAGQLGISVPSVSQHLFGRSRDGKVIGGAIPKLRKKLTQLHAGELKLG